MKIMAIKKGRAKFIILIFLIIFVASLFLLIFFTKKNDIRVKETGSLYEFLEDSRWPISIGDLEKIFQIVSEKKQNKYGHDATIINSTYLNGDFKIEKIGGLNNAFIETYFNDKKLYIESSYVKSLSPYPEVITNTIECPEEFKPKLTEYENGDMRLLAYDFLTNDRFTYGVCSDDLATHRGQSVSVYCIKSKELYNIELSVPINDSKNILNMNYDAISCKGS